MISIPAYLRSSLLQSFQEEKLVPDSYFDKIFPTQISKVSQTHWTPLEVVRSVVNQLPFDSHLKVLDIGSGCGKFCLAGALMRSDLLFTGIEFRKDLTDIATSLALQLSLTNVNFINADVLTMEWENFDVLYFYNPFWENHLSLEQRIDSRVPVKKENFDSAIKKVIYKLDSLPEDTLIITYHGIGRRLPPSYECLHFETCGSDQIEVWRKIK